MPITKLLLVDDHQLVLDGLVAIFNEVENLEIVGAVNDGKEAMRYIENVHIDLVLTDIDMGEMSGIDLTKKIKETGKDCKVIVLTMHNEKSMIKELIELGADGYLLKTASESEMKSALKSVIDGNKYISSDVTNTLLTNNDQIDQDVDLSQREIEILQLVAEGYTNKEIGEKLFISHRTVDTHRTNMMRKLDVKNIASLIRYAMKNSLID
jgi:two-component system response regulator NreC